MYWKNIPDPRYEEGEGDPVLQDRDNVIEFLDDAQNGFITKNGRCYCCRYRPR